MDLMLLRHHLSPKHQIYFKERTLAHRFFVLMLRMGFIR
ncbi:hypothetical protein RV05_GL001865 [Enterococcus hirae]|nr:hypothetical protein RV05_GL001865 [Enterococcus hirae]